MDRRPRPLPLAAFPATSALARCTQEAQNELGRAVRNWNVFYENPK